MPPNTLVVHSVLPGVGWLPSTPPLVEGERADSQQPVRNKGAIGYSCEVPLISPPASREGGGAETSHFPLDGNPFGVPLSRGAQLVILTRSTNSWISHYLEVVSYLRVTEEHRAF